MARALTNLDLAVHMDDRSAMCIGRRKGCHIRLKDPKVSADHLKLFVGRSYNGRIGLYAQALGYNGTYLNGERMEMHEHYKLQIGDVLSVLQPWKDHHEFHLDYFRIHTLEQELPVGRRMSGGG